MSSSPEDQNSLDLQQYLQVLKKRWLITASIIASVFGLTGLVTFSQKSIYEAQGKLLLKRSEVSSLTGSSQKEGELNGLTPTSSPIDTEAEIIRSNPIIQKTIDKLQLKNQQGKPIKIEEFLKKLKVKGIKGTDVMELTYQSPSPTEAATVVNTLMKIYLENNILTNRAETTSGKEFLSKQLPHIENRVVQAEVTLRRFKDANQVVSLEEEARQGVQQINNLSNDMTKARAQLEDAKSRSVGLQNQLALTTQQAVKLSTLSQSPGVQQVLTEYQKVQDELAVAQTRLTAEHPTVKNLINKEQALKQQLVQRVGQIVDNPESIPEQNLQVGQLKQALTAELVKSEVDRLALTSQVGVLQKAFWSSQVRLRTLPQLEQRQRALERRLQVAQNTYQQALKQLQEMEVLEKQKVGNVRIVSQALIPDKASSPKIPLNLALGGFLGVLLGVGTTLVLEAMDKSLKTVEEVKRLLSYPLLGSIPQISHKEGVLSELPTRDNPHSSASAAFEMLMTSLGFTFGDKQLRVILVTSSVPQEGKSFVAANLAVANAQIGRRVLLVDANIRQPRQHEIWQLPNIVGLSNVLVGQGDLQNTAQVIFGLEVITSGAIPANPLAILNSHRMTALIKDAVNNYDFVIIDAPCLSTAAETQILSKLVDGVLLVVHPGVVNAGAATAAKSLLEQSGQRVLGMVVNGVTTEISGYYNHRGYYEKNSSDRNSQDQVKLPNIGFF